MLSRLIILTALTVATLPIVNAQDTTGTAEIATTSTEVQSAVPETTVSVPSSPQAETTPAPADNNTQTQIRPDPSKPLDLAMLASATSETLSNGVIIFDYHPGTGDEITTSVKIRCHYRLFLMDGTLIESRHDSALPMPYEVVAVESQVIAGFATGLQGMKLGGIRYIEVPSSLAYGERGTTTIPANSDVIFEVHFVAIKEGEKPWVDIYNRKP